jgi:hypothetical protein
MDTKDSYTDIFDERLDALFEHHIEELATLYRANEPPVQLSWTRLQLQMRKKNLVSSKQQKMALNWMRPKPRAPHRLALAMILILLLLLISGFAYGTFYLPTSCATRLQGVAERTEMSLLKRKETNIPLRRRLKDYYLPFVGQNPDLRAVGSLGSHLVRRGHGAGSPLKQAEAARTYQ